MPSSRRRKPAARAEVPFTIRIPQGLRDGLDSFAAKHDRTRAWVIRKALQEFLDRQATGA